MFHGRAGAGAAKLVIAGVVLAALGIWFLAARRGQTIVDVEGVRTSSAFGRRWCRWSKVTDVELCIDANLAGCNSYFGVLGDFGTAASAGKGLAAAAGLLPGGNWPAPGDSAETCSWISSSRHVWVEIVVASMWTC